MLRCRSTTSSRSVLHQIPFGAARKCLRSEARKRIIPKEGWLPICGNQSFDETKITLRDKVPPVAVCDEITEVSITNNGLNTGESCSTNSSGWHT